MRSIVAHGTDTGTGTSADTRAYTGAAAFGEEQDRVDVAGVAAEGQDTAQQALGDDVRGARLMGLQGEGRQGQPGGGGQNPARVAALGEMVDDRGDRLDS